MSQVKESSSSSGTTGALPRKADPLWSSIQPTPSQDVGDALAPSSDLEKIMWGLDGIPPEGEGDDGVARGRGGGEHQQNEDDAQQLQEQESGGITPSSSADIEEAKTGSNDDAADISAVASACASDGVSLSCIAWKKRSGLGQFSQGYVRKAWERRRVLIVGTKMIYYETFGDSETKEDSIKLRPRGILDLVEEKCTIEIVDPASDGAPTLFEADIVSEDKETRWKFCFDTPEDLSEVFEATKSLLSEAGIGSDPTNDDPESFEHNFEAGDHIYRWEMIIFPPVIYPIQIHGIVLEAGKNVIVVADFGMTGYGKKEGSSFKHADADDEHDLQDNLQAAWRKFRPNEDQRLNIVTITDPKEIHKWFKASYGEGGLLSHHGKKKPKKRMLGKLSAVFNKSTDSQHLERRAISASAALARANTSEGSTAVHGDGTTLSPDKPKATKRSSTTSEIEPEGPRSADEEGVPDWFDNGGGLSASEHEPSVFSIAKNEHADSNLPKSDPTDLVLARANFLLERGEVVLPPYHVFYSNSECIAVWCKTGRWSTIQTAVFLATNSVGGAKSSTLGIIGIAAAHAIFVPLAVVGGLIWVSTPMLILKKSREKWEEATEKLTDLFWQSAPPEAFICAIENWSSIALEEEEDDDEEHLYTVDE
mmetsp:Transcript_15924/g.45785  ORF Transcript_15924/g.45785 Transcript_15924/m.45785 type:complete len:650 (+) Transcript_15924:26-1975(+)